MIETVNESVVTIEPKIVMAGGWGEIGGDIADQADLVAEFAKKMDVEPTVLLVNADLNSLNTGGVYSTYQPINAPVSGGYQWYVSVISDGMVITQAAYNVNTKSIYFRMTDMVMWSGVVWQKMATEYDIATLYTALFDSIGDVMDSVNNKVDKVAGKELSTNDYTDTEKTKLGSAVTSSTIATIVTLTQTAYDAIPIKDPNIMYIITGA